MHGFLQYMQPFLYFYIRFWEPYLSDVMFSVTHSFQSGYSEQGYVCNGTRWNAVPEVISQKDASRNGVPEHFFFLASV